MNSKSEYFINKTLGEDFLESLQKFELWKPGTKTVIDHEEIKTALQIVPRTIMSLLIKELIPMEIGQNRDIELPIASGSNNLLKITKHEKDVYSGEIISDNKKIVDFKYRSIPGVGLVIMSAYELYGVEELKTKSPDIEISEKIQKIIDDRLALHSLVNQIVDKKIELRDGVHQKFLKELADLVNISRTTVPLEDEYFRGIANDIEAVNSVATKQEPNFVEPINKVEKIKGSPVKEFLAKREQKKAKKEFDIHLDKSEKVSCPDCGKEIFNEKVFSGCICYGDDRDKKIYMKKTETGVKIRFGRGWDPENIAMLLETLRNKND
jgi:hypothetical protein